TCVIKKNAFNALVGGSGAGKSTLADILLGLLEPAEGEFSCGDVKINRQNLRFWQARIGYVPQSIFLVDDTVERNIAFGIPEDEVDRERVLQAARMAQLEAVFPDLSEGLKSKVGESGARLSGGQVQRIGIARALYKNPDVLIFDEATSALDNVTEAQIISAIRTISNQKTVIMIAHRLSTIIDAENIILLEKGRVMDQGSYDELYDASAEFRRLVSGGKEDAGAMKLDS
nr:ATP-binding cassette domain-containing protein [Methylococcales bacterium]